MRSRVTGGKRPEAAQHIGAIFLADRFAARSDYRCNGLHVAGRINFFLNLLAHMTNNIVMRVVNAQNPTGCRAALGNGRDRVDMGAHGEFGTTPFLRTKHAEQTRIMEQLDVFQRNLAVLFRLKGAGG